MLHFASALFQQRPCSAQVEQSESIFLIHSHSELHIMSDELQILTRKWYGMEEKGSIIFILQNASTATKINASFSLSECLLSLSLSFSHRIFGIKLRRRGEELFEERVSE